MGVHANPLLADPRDQAMVVRQPMHRRMADADPRPEHQQADLIDRHRRMRIKPVQDEPGRFLIENAAFEIEVTPPVLNESRRKNRKKNIRTTVCFRCCPAVT